MKMEIIEKFKNLKNNEKIFLVARVFDIWSDGIEYNKKEKFIPQDVGVKNEKDISKVFKFLSNVETSERVEKLTKEFQALEFYEKLDFMIFIFEYINDDEKINEKILTKITDKLDFKELSDLILKYKALL